MAGRSSRVVVSRKCQINGSPGPRRHQLIPRLVFPCHRGESMYMYTCVSIRVDRSVDINIGKLDIGERPGLVRLRLLANIEGGWLMATVPCSEPFDQHRGTRERAAPPSRDLGRAVETSLCWLAREWKRNLISSHIEFFLRLVIGCNNRSPTRVHG